MRGTRSDGELRARRHDADRVVGPFDGVDGRVEDHVVAELGRESERHLLEAADDPLVEDEVGVHEVTEAARAGRHQQRLQQRERVRGLGEHGVGDEQGDVLDRLLVVGLLGQPLTEGDAVVFVGVRMVPGRRRIDLCGQLVHELYEPVELALGSTAKRGRWPPRSGE